MILGFGSYLKDYLEINNISQVEFAERLDITPKHLNEILNKDIDMSNDLMIAISLFTDIDIRFIIKIENSKHMKQYLIKNFGDNLKDYLKQFNINELEKNKWVTFRHKEDIYQNAIDLLEFLKVKNFNAMNTISNNIMYKKKNDSDDTKVLLWLARCNELAKEQKVLDYKKDSIDNLLNFLKNERNKKFNYELIRDEFNKNGIYFVIEDALKGMKIRGCSKVKKDKPCIYLTRLYNDKASIYFALYHELGHIKQSYNKLKSKYIIDSDDSLEAKADQFALDNMISMELIKNIINSNNIVDTSKNISKEYNIPLCFIVRTLAYNNYIKYTDKFYLNNIEKVW